ncbi:MAG: response regulator, partial [Candidatus Cloacimonetes bacterium]|nr:response regulator [Candidatus Cloacimonadota bacterium]
MKQKILFVDDQTKVLLGLERMLHDQRDKWDMTFISSSLEALKWIAQESCDVAVLDVNMPGKNGIELLTDIKSDFHTKNTEVIMLTGLQDQKF